MGEDLLKNLDLAVVSMQDLLYLIMLFLSGTVLGFTV